MIFFKQIFNFQELIMIKLKAIFKKREHYEKINYKKCILFSN
jgi:hypothetical protein